MIYRITHADPDGNGCEHAVEADSRRDAIAHVLADLLNYPVNIERAIMPPGLVIYVLDPGAIEPERMTVVLTDVISVTPYPEERVLH